MRLINKLGLGTILAAALMVLAGQSSAQTICTGNIDSLTPSTGGTGTCDRIWGDDADEAFVVVDGPVFVLDTKLTILPGTIVRGQPRTAAFDPSTPLVGFPGVLVITRGAFLDARGTKNDPIILTTAALNDPASTGNTLKLSNGKPAPYTGAAGETFLDDDPANDPLAPLQADGSSAYGLHGGLVINGYAPTNLDDTATGIEGEGIVEGIPVPGVAPAAATYGGNSPHDSSGVLEYFSIRHAGDELEPNKELNGYTLAGVGDGTVLSYVDAYANGDDGFEMFGGTVNLDHVVAAWIGDDSIDTDQGYSGQIQSVLTLSLFFKDDQGGDIGSGGSGDAAGEIDGEDCPECIVGFDGFVLPQPDFLAGNWTAMGNIAAALNGSGVTNPATVANSGNEGIQIDTQATPTIFNTVMLGWTGTSAGPAIEYNSSGRPDICSIVATTTDNGFDAGATVCGTTGDTRVAAGNKYIGGSANFPSVTGQQLLVNENHFFDPNGVASGGRQRLQGSKTDDAGNVGGPAFDPRPLNPADANVSGGIQPQWAGMDSSQTQRGGFPAGTENWTAGWSTISLGGIIAD
jgi:hypothetical protein